MGRQKIKWADIRKEVVKCNKDLANAIDQLDPSLPLEFGSFNYGEEITSSPEHESFLVLGKSAEIFFEYQGNPLTYSLIQTGEFGLLEHLLEQPPLFWRNSPWKATAGSRSVFMIPKVCDAVRHKKMEYALNFEVKKPEEPQMHWDVFKSIANSPEIKNEWKCPVLFFDKDNWGKHHNDPAWQSFYRLLSQNFLHRTEFQQQQALLDMLIGVAQHERNIRFSLPQAEEIRHLLMMGMKGVPGFKLAHDDESLPNSLIQTTYIEHYGLSEYPPLILNPHYFDWKKDSETPIYSSFNHPTSYYLSPKINNFKTNAQEMHLFVWAFKKFVDFVLHKGFVSEESALHQFLASCEFSFYHHKTEDYRDFVSPTLIPMHDPDLMQGWDKQFQFPMHGAFWKACVGIRKIQQP